MENLKELSIEEQISYDGGGWRDIGRAIGRWLDSWNDGTTNGCEPYDENLIPGNNFVS
ncbi:hypothetical protein [Flavobacterium sp.]|uniref:hypothetical protein n=1 Tax=Flavobacterium sp. TaxID=239 RepID=UPI0040480C2E